MKEYGESDAVKTFLDYLHGHFSEIQLENFNTFKTFSQNPNNYLRDIEDEFEQQRIEIQSDIDELTSQIQSYKYDLKKVKSELYRKYKTVKKVYGQLKEQIQAEIDDLQADESILTKGIEKREKEVKDATLDLQNLEDEKGHVLPAIESDLVTYEKIKGEFEFKTQLKGAYGERNVIDHLTQHYQKDSTKYLINGFDINLMGQAISHNNHTLLENKIDHLLFTTKGIFVLETKAWQTVTEEGTSRVHNQMTKIQQVFSEIFRKELAQYPFQFVVLTTESPMSIPDFNSYSLRDFTTYLDQCPEVISKNDLNILLNQILPYLNEGHIGSLDKVSIKVKGLFSRAKKALSKKTT